MNLDQTIFNWAVGLVGVLGGVILRATWDAIQKQRDENVQMARTISELSSQIAREYVRRDDYRDDISEIKGMLVRIFDLLDKKADKQ